MKINELFENSSSIFERWFSGSRVVDEHGRPKKMFHGTGHGDISDFSIDRASPTALYGPGFYFTDNPDVAGGTGGGRDEEEINAKADWNVAGYAFQRQQYRLDQPFSKQQMSRILRRMDGPERREARQDIGMQQSWNAVARAMHPWIEAYNSEKTAIAEKDRKAAADARQTMIATEREFRDFMSSNVRKIPLIGSLLRFVGVEPTRTTAPVVFPVFLRIIKPFEIEGKVDIDLFERMWAASPEPKNSFLNLIKPIKRGYPSDELNGGIAWNWLVRDVLEGREDSKTEANSIIQQLGYDGIHHKGGNVIRTMGEHDVWIAFFPNQIKSMFSRGFNPNSPHISEAVFVDAPVSKIYWGNNFAPLSVIDSKEEIPIYHQLTTDEMRDLLQRHRKLRVVITANDVFAADAYIAAHAGMNAILRKSGVDTQGAVNAIITSPTSLTYAWKKYEFHPGGNGLRRRWNDIRKIILDNPVIQKMFNGNVSIIRDEWT